MRGARAASCSCSFIVWQQTNQDQKLSRRDGASHLSLLVQRNLAQRKHTPPARPVLRTGFAEPAGFSEGASCPRGKRRASMRGAPAGSVRRLRRFGGAPKVKFKINSECIDSSSLVGAAEAASLCLCPCGSGFSRELLPRAANVFLHASQKQSPRRTTRASPIRNSDGFSRGCRRSAPAPPPAPVVRPSSPAGTSSSAARTCARRCRVRGGRCCAQIGRHTSELQSLMRISYAVFCLKKKTIQNKTYQ